MATKVCIHLRQSSLSVIGFDFCTKLLLQVTLIGSTSLCYFITYAATVWIITFSHTQVSSAVPEGKGVSSSASVEVASMSAIAAAHGNSRILIFPMQLV